MEKYGEAIMAHYRKEAREKFGQESIMMKKHR